MDTVQLPEKHAQQVVELYMRYQGAAESAQAAAQAANTALMRMNDIVVALGKELLPEGRTGKFDPDKLEWQLDPAKEDKKKENTV